LSYAIETDSLTKKFPAAKSYHDIILHPFRRKEITVLNNVNIQVKKGDVFGLLGPNGAGKTTLIKILCTLILPSSGKAFINGLEVAGNAKTTRKTIGYVVSDERSFYWRLTGIQNLKFFAKLNNIPDREAGKRIGRLLDFMDLTEDAGRPFKDYSSGMRQKLAIARGLLTDPEVIFMDEPTNRLDPVTSQNLKTIIKEKLAGDGKKTVVFATHILRDAEEICNGLAIIHKGEVKFAGALGDLKMDPDTCKTFIARLKRPEGNILQKIGLMPHVKKIKSVSNGTFSTVPQVDVEIAAHEGSVSGAIREIVNMGGELCSLHEKGAALEELFSRIVGAK